MSLTINLIQWEQSIRLTQTEEDIIALFERQDPVVPSKSNDYQQGNIVSVKVLENLVKTKQVPEDQNVLQIEEILADYERQKNVFQMLLEKLAVIAEQLKLLEQNNEQVVQLINDFHNQSNQYIQQQKAMIEMQGRIQEYLQYYTNVEKLQHELQNEQIEQIQRLMSEINDGYLFFNTHPQYQNSAKYLGLYQQLRRKLISLVKGHLIRIINKEFSFTTSNISKMQILTLFIQIEELPNPMKLQFFQLMFPQLYPALQIKQQKIKKLDENFETFQIKDNFKKFCYFLENQISNDPEIMSLFNDVFMELRSDSRMSIHQGINEQFQKQLASVNVIGQNLLKIKLQLLEQKPQKTNEELDFLQNKCPAEAIVFESLMNFVFEIYLVETLYFKTLFSFGHSVIEDKSQNLLSQICETYQLTLKTYIHKNKSLDILLRCAAITKKISSQTSELFKALVDQQIPQDHYLFYISSYVKLKPEENYLVNAIGLFNTEILEKTKIDLMQRIIAMCHVTIQDQIYSFSVKEYLSKEMRQSKLQIYKYYPPEVQPPKHYVLQKNHVFPTVEKGVTLIVRLSEFVHQKVFEQLAGEILREINSQIKEVSDKYELKFDSYLFLIKQLMILTDSLLPLGGNFIIKEQELDFTETKTMLLQVISGQVRPNIKWIELTSAEKLWSYTTNFFAFIYSGMPRLNQYEVDLKQTLISQLKNVGFSFVKDMTFVICKNVIDFLRKYQYLQYIIEGEDQQQNQTQVSVDQAQKDLQNLLQSENIKKIYVFYLDNLYEFTDEMVSKLNNYTNPQLFEKIKPYIGDVVSNSISLLSQFYITVSKHFKDELYDQFSFQSIEEINQATSKQLCYY